MDLQRVIYSVANFLVLMGFSLQKKKEINIRSQVLSKVGLFSILDN